MNQAAAEVNAYRDGVLGGLEQWGVLTSVGQRLDPTEHLLQCGVLAMAMRTAQERDHAANLPDWQSSSVVGIVPA
jgi:hypothetical protein